MRPLIKLLQELLSAIRPLADHLSSCLHSKNLGDLVRQPRGSAARTVSPKG